MVPEFPEYMTFPAPAGDDLWGIWPRVRARIKGEYSLDDVAGMNTDINRKIRYQRELLWQTPSETLAKGSGDCKDYATLKYATLRWLLVSESNLALVVAEIIAMPQNEPHAFCCWFDPNKRAWFVLDSKFDQLIEPKDYINLKPLKACQGGMISLYSKVIVPGAHQ